MNKLVLSATVTSLLVVSPLAMSEPVVFSGAAEDAAGLEAIVDDFRLHLGDLNPNVVGSFQDGRREINWDGVGDGDADPNPFPPNFFNDPQDGSPRGVVLFTPGSKLLVSANSDNPTHTEIEFGDIKHRFPKQFATFSPERLFTPIDNTIVEVLFFEPGLPQSATVSGFGAVFTDVDKDGRTKIEYLDIDGNLLHSQTVERGPKSKESLSFLGVAFDEGEQVYLVRITSGDRAIGKRSRGRDEVVMDDFIYAEPQPLQ